MNSAYEINEALENNVFYFTNATNEDFVFLWNNKEYIFPAETCCPMLIPSESAENIQAIRKKAAYKLATREFYKGKDYKGMVKIGKANPSTFDEKVLQPWIDECLKPLPIAKAKVKALPKDSDKGYRATRAVSDKGDLAYEFRDMEPETVGAQSTTVNMAL